MIIIVNNKSIVPVRILWAIIFSLMVILLSFEPNGMAKEESLHQKAVNYARQGKTLQALKMIEDAIASGEVKEDVVWDYIIILSWAEKYEKAIEVYEGFLEKHRPPVYALLDVARCYRNIDEFDKAITLYKKYLQRDTDNKRDAWKGLIYIYLDTDRSNEITQYIQNEIDKNPFRMDPKFAYAMLLEAQKEYIKAYEMYQAILYLYPENQEAYNLQCQLLVNMGAYSIVRDRLDNPLRKVDPELVKLLKGDEAVSRMRWGKIDQAVDMLEENIGIDKDASSEKTYSQSELRAYYDMIVAYRKKEKMNKVIGLYTHLIQQGILIPDWVKTNVADAYLALKNPEQAETLYREVLHSKNNIKEIGMSLYHALVEQGKYREAGELLVTLDKQLPVQVIQRGVLQDNWDKEAVAYSHAWWLLAQDRLEEAQEYLEDLLLKAPFNTHTRLALAQTYLWRGWPRRALKEFEIVISIDPDDVASQVGYCYALHENNYGDKAREIAKELIERYPRNAHVKRLAKYFALYDRPDVAVYTGLMNEYPGAHERSASVKISQAVASWRKLFIEYLFRHTSQDDVKAQTRRMMLGTELRFTDKWWYRGVLSSDQNSDNFGFLQEITFTPDDYWSFVCLYDSYSVSVPLRARITGVDAHQWQLKTQYRMSEQLNSEVGVSWYQISDGNDQVSYTMRFDKALTTKAYWKTRLALEGYLGKNSKTDVSYYSPDNVYSVYVVPTVEHLWFREYERALKDRISVGLGTQKESGISGREVWFLDYGQDYAMSDASSLQYGARYAQRNYDGAGIDEWTFYINLLTTF